MIEQSIETPSETKTLDSAEIMARVVYALAPDGKPFPLGPWGKWDKLSEDARAIRILEQRAALAALCRPIETAPKDGTRILLYWPHLREGHRWQSGCWHDTVHTSHGRVTYESKGWAGLDFFYDKKEPTHWMPLPEEPTPEAQSDEQA